ncbi:hypothetical protein BX600DRAFT_320800 [Xylariales sp. PMI_506]|nr:hypothetical protein BX600DRAFT_320800 [Xylariales sp. PMI_506]
MPNTGKPSKNCELCRQRRVKCDLTRPACVRCVRYGAICPGYRDALGLKFRNQNVDTAQGHTKTRKLTHYRQLAPAPSHRKPVVPTPNAISFAGVAHAPGNLLLSERVVNNYPAFLGPLDLPVLSPRASDFFVLKYFPPSSDNASKIGRLDFVPSLYFQANETSCLFCVTEMLAGASSSDHQHDTKLYQRGLRAVQTALNSNSDAVKDETLVAVWMLAIYELLTGSPQTTPRPGPDAWHLHINGIALLLKIRGIEQVNSPRGRSLFWIMHAHILIRSLMLNISCPLESRDGYALFIASANPCPDESEEAIALVWKYLIRVSDIIATIMGKSCCGPVSIDNYIAYLGMSDTIEAIVSPSVYSHHSKVPSNTYTWNLYRTGRMKMHHLLVYLINSITARSELCASASPTKEDLTYLELKRQDSLAITRAMAQDVLDTVPPAIFSSSQIRARAVSDSDSRGQDCRTPISWTDAVRLTWPLGVISTMTTVRLDQQCAAQDARSAIGRIWGIREALKRSQRTPVVPHEALWANGGEIRGTKG